MAEQIIPKRLWDIAKELGMNSITFVKTDTTFGDVFSLGIVDEDGSFLPIGLPILFGVKGSEINEIVPEAAHDILSTIK